MLLAVSGGPDSIALLHLLRSCAAENEWLLVAAHFDHGLREESAREACSVAKWVEALGLRCSVGRPSRPLPARQESFRRARYEFLQEVAEAEAADRIVTAHHADDQAETVLFRILRGTGIRGLGGIPERRGIIVRPLLPFWREELRAYLDERSIPYLTDPSNEDPRWSRVRIRTLALPALERSWDGPVRERLVSLARSAREADRALVAQAREALERCCVVGPAGGFRFVRSCLAEYHRTVQARAVALLAERLDVRLSRGGTRVAVEFIRGGRSGASVDVGGGLSLRREFEHLWLGFPAPDAGEIPLRIPSAGSGRGVLRLGERRFRVAWTSPPPPGHVDGVSAEEVFDLRLGGGASFPLEMRRWRAGDRIRLAAGSRKVKRLFTDHRVPLSERGRIPILVDAEGRVLWVWRLAKAGPPPAHAPPPKAGPPPAHEEPCGVSDGLSIEVEEL
ncbi:MAG: tRNA lysidine(34) synthetase TilS [Gemmatimonadota bacterium]